MGYCQQVLFRSRAAGEASVNELMWDCRKLKSILRSTEFKGNLVDVVRETVSTRKVSDLSAPEHFFEVELQGIVRHKNHPPSRSSFDLRLSFAGCASAFLTGLQISG